jgi:phosphotransferase system HPr-like phosphotransfer protein
MKILINTIEKVKKFCSLTIMQDYDLSLHSGRYVIDAKSILGVFSIDISKPVAMHIDTEGVDIEQVKETFKDFIVEE